MRINVRLPGGGEIRLEKHPMKEDRFELLCFCGVCGIAVAALVSVVSILV